MAKGTKSDQTNSDQAKSGHNKPAYRQKSAYQSAERAGRWAEWLVLLFYMIRGFWLIAWRKNTPYGEIDLIVRRGHHIRFIEVKYRTHINAFDSPVTAHQIKRLRAAAHLCYHSYCPDGDASCQFDVVLVRRWWRIKPFYNHILLS